MEPGGGSPPAAPGSARSCVGVAHSRPPRVRARHCGHAPPSGGDAPGKARGREPRAPFWSRCPGRGAEGLRGGGSSLSFSPRRVVSGAGRGRRGTGKEGFSLGSQSRKGGSALVPSAGPASRMRAERGGPRRREPEARGPGGLM